ncbi:MAG TPA: hypothetical protein VIS29_01230 [Streptomyces sp.]|jgi:hypothetical protein
MSDSAQAVLLAVFALAGCVWVGGYVAIAVVARTAAAALEPGQRVVFFRALGRAYLLIGAPALVIALGTGACLLRDHPWDATLTATAVVAAALVGSFAVAVVQAKRMTRLRRAALANPQETDFARRISAGARAATALRAALGVLSLALVVLGSFLAV